MRHAVAMLAGAAAAAAGALILGEYAFTGLTPYLAGLLYGLVVSEVVLAVSPKRSWLLGAEAAVVCVAGLAWAVWISTGHGVAPVPGGVWVGVPLAAVVAGGRLAGLGPGALRASRPGAGGTHSHPSPPPSAPPSS